MVGTTPTDRAVLVYLDTNAWNGLVADAPEFTAADLIAGYRSGDIAVVSSLEVLEELMGTTARKPTKSATMRSLWRRLCSSRILAPLDVRHRLEVQGDGLLSVENRYLSPSVVRGVLQLASNRWVSGQVNGEVRRRKEHHFAGDRAARDGLLSEVESLGKRLRDFERRVDAKVVDQLVRDIVADGPQYGLPNVKPEAATYGRVPSLWLLVAASAARLTRTAGENRKVRASDNHDRLHAAAGAYYDVLVTDDAEFRSTLALVPNRPFAVVSAAELAGHLRERAVLGLVAEHRD